MFVAIDEPDGELRQRIATSVQRPGERLATEPDVQRKVDECAATALAHLVDNYRNEVSEIIASTVAKWDADATADTLELQVGRDLQFIRINGTVVGRPGRIRDPCHRPTAVNHPPSSVSVVDGTVAERTNAPALKADDLHGSGGSNPPRSAKT